ncbi:MAG: glycosyltransferase, partial [Caldilineaceae bacterium]
MTQITLMATGSRGDVQPYVALGRGLREAGHQVRLVSSDDFAGLVDDAGLEYGSTGMGIEERLQSEEWRGVIESGNFLKILQKMQSEMKRSAAGVAERLPALMEGSELIISGLGAAVGTQALAAQRGIPVLYAYVVPMSPTSEFASPLVPSLPLGKALNRLSFRVTRQLFWQSGRVGDVTARKVLGLPKGSFWGPGAERAQSGLPTLFGYSSHVIARPRDWDTSHHVTGYWFLDEPSGWQPPADLLAFLAAGPPPVYIGFGSMSSRDPQEAGRIALEALARSGQRGVLATGWGGLKPESVPDSVHLISSIPHSWLFARMAAVVHHGGAGTTAAGLRAGVPSILV